MTIYYIIKDGFVVEFKLDQYTLPRRRGGFDTYTKLLVCVRRVEKNTVSTLYPFNQLVNNDNPELVKDMHDAAWTTFREACALCHLSPVCDDAFGAYNAIRKRWEREEEDA